MNASETEKAVVDANVLIHSRGQFPVKTALMPPSVYGEVKSEISQLKMEKLNVQPIDPSEESLDKVKVKSQEISSPTSKQDERALALAIDQNILLITDDKALQNLALYLEADFDTFNTEKVSEKRSWKMVCDNCGTEVSSLPCSRCGSRNLSRKRDQSS